MKDYNQTGRSDHKTSLFLEQELHWHFFGILLDTVNNEAFTHAKVF